MDYRKPTNPEAGPSDTVPAMLTPGEAVIPAPAAQNPDNAPVIQEMIAEGRMKNRIAEANSEKFGFEGGTMDVPAMMMMAPPKDPTMDEMKRIALKQMGYEQKSKNRTRDTVEKIGLKHLEETATADMKQMALDETMRNYGAQVPAPMQEVPQGFYMGSDGVQYKDKETADMYAAIQAQREFVSPEETSYFTPRPDDTPIERFLDPIGASIAGFPGAIGRGATTLAEQQGNLLLQQAQTGQAMGTGVTNLFRPLDEQREVPSILKPAQPVQAPQAPQVAVREDRKPKPPETPKKEGGFLSALGKGFSSLGEGFSSALGEGVSAAFKSVFDSESIATAGIYYGVNRLLGYDNETAAQQAAAGYNLGQKNRLAKLEYARKAGLESIDDARQRDENSAENIGRLQDSISSQLDDEISDETLTEVGLSRADVANRVNLMIQSRGLDLSTTKGLNAARTLATRVTSNYSKRINSGLEASPEEEFDRVLLSQYELTQALTDNDGKPLSEAATRGSFDKIRRNVAVDRGVKEDEAQFVFEDRVNQAYQIFTNPANADRIQALRDQGLLTPDSGENEFSLFLAHVLKDRDSRVRQF